MSTPFYLSYTVLWILVILHSLLLLGVVRLVYQLQTSAGSLGESESVGLKSGERAPTFQAVDLSGRVVSSREHEGRSRALLFVSPNCPSCTATLYEIEALSSKAKGDVMIICRGAQGECQELTGNHDLHIPIIVDEDELVTRLYGVSSHPTAVIISDRDRIQSYGHPLRATDLEGAIEDANDDVRQEVG